MTTLALIFSYIEVLIPFNFGVPGIKLGIANLVVIIALYRLGYRYALGINTVRVLVAGLCSADSSEHFIRWRERLCPLQ